MSDIIQEAHTMTMRISVDERLVRASIVAGLQSSAPLIVLTAAAVTALSHELGGTERATRWLLNQVERHQKPVAVHMNDETRFYAPPDWNEERLAGYVAAHHTALEAQFGEIASFSRERSGPNG